MLARGNFGSSCGDAGGKSSCDEQIFVVMVSDGLTSLCVMLDMKFCWLVDGVSFTVVALRERTSEWVRLGYSRLNVILWRKYVSANCLLVDASVEQGVRTDEGEQLLAYSFLFSHL